MIVAHDNRVSLVVTGSPRHAWKRSHVLLIDSPKMIDTALAMFDIERIILDRTATSDEFLYLLATLPAAVAGDVMLVRDDGGAFLSSIGRGGDRVLYALAPHDVDFYIETHGLTAGDALALTA